jgi:hypothetical protein
MPPHSMVGEERVQSSEERMQSSTTTRIALDGQMNAIMDTNQYMQLK